MVEHRLIEHMIGLLKEDVSRIKEGKGDLVPLDYAIKSLQS